MLDTGIAKSRIGGSLGTVPLHQINHKSGKQWFNVHNEFNHNRYPRHGKIPVEPVELRRD
jgi:hypothetical protein